MAADQFDLFALPKPALALVVGALGPGDRERLQLVSRSWSKQFTTEPLLSTQLVVRVSKLEACPRWQRRLAARGRHTEELTLLTSPSAARQHRGAYDEDYEDDDYECDDYGSDSAEGCDPKALHSKLLKCFKAGRLRRLTVVGCIAHSALCSQLASSRSLKHIELRHTDAEAGCCSLRASCLAHQLLDREEDEQLLPAGLQALSLRLLVLTEPALLLDDLAGCSALTALELGGLSTDDYDGVEEDLAGLTSLHRLVLRAEVISSDPYGDEIAPGELSLGSGFGGSSDFPLAHLTRLTSLILTGSTHAHPGLGRPLNSRLYAVMPGLARISVAEGLAQLPQLQELHLDGLVVAVPADLWQCTTLSRLVIRGVPVQSSGGEDPLTELPPLNGARLPHLRALCVRSLIAPAGLVRKLVAAAPQLTALALGDLDSKRDGGGDGTSDFAADLHHAAKLTALQELDLSSLELEAEEWDRLLPALKPLTALTALRLADSRLNSLPESGPYANLEELDISETFLRECPPWLPSACPRLRVLNIGFCGADRGTYEDEDPLALTPAVRELVTRTSGARLKELTITATRYYGRAGRFAQLEPRQASARAIFEELLALSNAGQLALKVADERFLEELEQPPHESWL